VGWWGGGGWGCGGGGVVVGGFSRSFVNPKILYILHDSDTPQIKSTQKHEVFGAAKTKTEGESLTW